MSLRDLVTFAQNEISRGELHDHREAPPTRDEPIFTEDEYSGRVPAEEDRDLPPIEPAERPPLPGWLQNPENEVSEIGGQFHDFFRGRV